MTNMSEERDTPRLTVTPRELAARLGVSKSFIYDQITARRIPHVRLGARRIVIELEQLDEYLRLLRCSAEEAAARIPLAKNIRRTEASHLEDSA